ncbi:uncharacterized protein LOC134825503 isoform X8 [Bolinopsis microptera]|uniref:uncharacterized protein LOC134825503 isoform X8 n=1 Tax=Bolinopsis microptera TaxID=2820187 RepID=UPI00307955F6
MSAEKSAEIPKTEAEIGLIKIEKVDSTEAVDMETDSVAPEEEKVRLEKEVQALEEEQKRIEQNKERDEVEKKAEEITKLINPDNDSSDDEHVTNVPSESHVEPEPPKVPFWDFALSHLLVGLGTLKIEEFSVYCGSCQKKMELDTLKIHLEGDGHKLNTLWNYDKSLAEVTGELRSYPHKFEMEMFKHITMLNRMEKRYDVAPEVATVVRDLYKGDDNKEKETSEEEEIVKISTISPEELAEIKAEFIGSFPNADDAILVQQALMGELEGFSSESSAQSALRIAGMLGKMISAYQRRHFKDGYKVNEECIRDIKGQCGKLLKGIDEAKLQSQIPH